MRRTLARAIALATAVALALAAPAAAETEIATVDAPTTIRSWKGIGAFSVYDRAESVFRLAVTRVGAAPELVPVAPRAVAFDADVGPDSDGEPAIVYSRCAQESVGFGHPRRDCDVYRYSLTRGVEARVANADSDTASEFHPTIWRGRIAWARTYDGRDDATPYVYTRELTAPRSRRSERLPGVPTRRCSEALDECWRTDTRSVDMLELYGRWLALGVTYDRRRTGTCGMREMRLDTLDGRARLLAGVGCGLGGQSYAGPSFDEGRLYWARYCAGDPGGCTTRDSGAFRYDLDSGDLALAPFTRRLTGFSYVDDGRAYEVRAPEARQGYCGNALPGTFPPCHVVMTDGLEFAPVRRR